MGQLLLLVYCHVFFFYHGSDKLVFFTTGVGHVSKYWFQIWWNISWCYTGINIKKERRYEGREGRKKKTCRYQDFLFKKLTRKVQNWAKRGAGMFKECWTLRYFDDGPSEWFQARETFDICFRDRMGSRFWNIQVIIVMLVNSAWLKQCV